MNLRQRRHRASDVRQSAIGSVRELASTMELACEAMWHSRCICNERRKDVNVPYNSQQATRELCLRGQRRAPRNRVIVLAILKSGARQGSGLVSNLIEKARHNLSETLRTTRGKMVYWPRLFLQIKTENRSDKSSSSVIL